MTHFKMVCQYDKLHGQCRCPSPNKAMRKIECTDPKNHKPASTSGVKSDDKS